MRTLGLVGRLTKRLRDHGLASVSLSSNVRGHKHKGGVIKRVACDLLFALISTLFISPVRAQIPQPIDLGIQNIPQETPLWCWAAVAQQIIFALRGPNGAPPQCALVALTSNVSPQACCQMPTRCMRTGHLQEIQGLSLHFGGLFSAITPPADPVTVYRTLVSQRAIIMAVKSSPFSGHVVVIRGIAWIPTPQGLQPVLYVNDPMGFFTQRVPFIDILGYWPAAIVVG